MTRSAGSLWAASCAALAPPSQLFADECAEIVVIGAGYTGLSAALHAAAAGRDVVVLEAGQIGAGGSGLNGGQVIAGLKHDPDVLESLYGQRVGAQLTHCSGSAPDLVFDLIRRYAIAGVLIAAFIIKSLPLRTLRWLVAAVVTYAAVAMLRSARGASAAPASDDPLDTKGVL